MTTSPFARFDGTLYSIHFPYAHEDKTPARKGVIELYVDFDYYTVSPYGGGFAMALRKDAEGLELLDDVPQLEEECWFALTDETLYLGKHNPRERWNGWATPKFSRAVIEQQIIPDLQKQGGDRWHYQKLDNGDWKVTEVDEDERYETLIKFDENDFAPFMSYEWCWSDEEETGELPNQPE